MTIIYKLNKNLTGRVATQLNWELEKLEGTIQIATKDDRFINGKSLIGLLSGGFKMDDIIEIFIEKDKDVELVRSSFKEI